MSQKSRKEYFLQRNFCHREQAQVGGILIKSMGGRGLKANSRIQWARNGPSLLEIDYYNRKPESG